MCGNFMKSPTLDLEGRIDRLYKEYFENLVNPLDRVEHDKLVQYCRDVEERIRQIKSNDLNGEENPLPEELSLSFFICSKNIEDDQKQLSGFGIRTQIRQFFVYRDLADEKRNNRDPVQEYRQVQSQEGGFCDERMHTATTYDNDKR